MSYKRFLKNQHDNENNKISSNASSEILGEEAQNIADEELEEEEEEDLCAEEEDLSAEEEECEGNAFCLLGGKIKLNEEIEKAEREEEEKQRKKEEETKAKSNLVEKRKLEREAIEKCKEAKKQKWLWKNLMALRIHFQKCFDKFNVFPVSTTVGCLPLFSFERKRRKILDDPKEEKSEDCEESWLRLRKTVADVLRSLLSLHYELSSKMSDKSTNTFLSAFHDGDSSTGEEEEEEKEEEKEEVEEEKEKEKNKEKEKKEKNKEKEKKKEKEKEEEKNSRLSRRRKWKDISSEEEREAWRKVNVWTGDFKMKCFNAADEWKMKTQLEVFKGFKVLDLSPSTQFRNSLRDFSRFLTKARNLKNAENIIGYELLKKLERHKNEKNDPSFTKAWNEYIMSQTFSDKDFYVDLLKSLLEEEADDVDNILSSNNEQKRLREEFRKSSNKKIVNRRASKGRVIRYVSIPQLANFTTASGFESVNESNVIPSISDSNFVTKLMISLFSSH